MTDSTKRVVTNLRKKFESLYKVVENEKDRADISEILLFIDKKLNN